MCKIIEDAFIIFAYIVYFFRCYECDEKLSTHCNKKVLAQIVDFLQKHVSKTQTSKLTAVAKEICIKVSYFLILIKR